MEKEDSLTTFLLYLLVRNILTLIVFARLAMYANKWWIVLFAAFFTLTPKTNQYLRKENNDDDL